MAFRLKSQGCATAAIQHCSNHKVACAEVWLEVISSDVRQTAVLHIHGSKVVFRVVRHLKISPQVHH